MAKDIQVRRDSDLSSPFDLMPEFERLAERFLGDRFGSIFGDLPTLPRRANLDVRETDKSYILTADVPGIPKENIDISVDGNVLTVRAEHKVEGGRDERHEFRRQYRSFQQSLTLPSNVDTDKIEAQCDNGQLEVWIPKAEASQGRKVEVQSGKGGFLNRLMGKGDKKEVNPSGSSQKH